MCDVMCKNLHMATNLALDPAILNEALSISGAKTKKEVVTMALKEFISRHKQKKLLDLFDKLEWDESYDYKKERQR